MLWASTPQNSKICSTTDQKLVKSKHAMKGKKRQEKAWGGDNFYQTSQCTAWISGLSAVTMRREIFSHREVAFKCPACPQKWPMLPAVWSWRREEYAFLKSVGSLKPKCKGGMNQLCTWFQFSVPVSMLWYSLSSILFLAAVKNLHASEGRSCAQGSGCCQWSPWELPQLFEGQSMLPVCIWLEKAIHQQDCIY